MGVEELLERTTIEFKGPLTHEEIESLLSYISKNLPCSLTYTFKDNADIEEGKKIVRGISFRGYLIVSTITGNFPLPFECKHVFDSYLFSALKFEHGMITPEEKRPEEIKTWDSVRELVTKHFKETYNK